ncbi:thiamine pyrophosphate-binding protein [Rhodococcus jostii]|uniref:acetolactate synthase n=1 Tax=Rhodococcus jostii TaxID=132919 RepID=A0A1H5I8W9_RHOJO|nr:5-guanidino-2-oxopentanoate decarboxylase [Rhodococcus jostii]SEE36682.1 acetolactate synthase-1/2/3 large subunit [Rhodococcus jostii]
MTSQNGGQALVAALAAHGVDTVFGIPGTHNLSVYAALTDSPIRSVLTRHEQGAGYAADGYARVTGKPGVCLTTTGPAILNAAAAAAQAWSDSVPVLFLSPALPLTHPGRGNGYLHEVKNQQAALEAIVAYSHRVTSVAEIPRAIAYAFAAMNSGRPRPVHIEIPVDILDAEADVRIVAPVEAAPLAAPSHAVTEAARFLADSTAPVLIVGGGARSAAPQVRALAERLSAPVLTTTNGKGVLDEDHPLSVGAGVHHPSVRAALESADCVVAIGTEFAPSDFWYGPVDLDRKLIRIDVDPTSMTTNADPAIRLLGDAATTVSQLLDVAKMREDSDAHERAAGFRRDLRADAAAEGAPWLDMMAAIAPVVDESTVIAGDSTMACYYGALSNLTVHRPGGFLYPTGQGTLGYGLPAAIGASVADPDGRVLAILGDGGVMFTLPELATAAQLRLPLPIVVVDNGGYGEIRNEMADRGDTVHSVTLGGIDFPAVARAMGCHGRAVESPAALTEAITAAFDADRPTLLHIRENSRATQQV